MNIEIDSIDKLKLQIKYQLKLKNIKNSVENIEIKAAKRREMKKFYFH